MLYARRRGVFHALVEKSSIVESKGGDGSSALENITNPTFKQNQQLFLPPAEAGLLI
jgi:hypothetical protein